MKLLLDQGLPLSAATLLRDANIDTIHVGEVEMSEAEDTDMIRRARDLSPSTWVIGPDEGEGRWGQHR